MARSRTSSGQQNEKLWVDKKTIASDYGVSLRTVDEWMSSRAIPFRRFSSRLVRFNRSEVERALRVHDVKEVQ